MPPLEWPPAHFHPEGPPLSSSPPLSLCSCFLKRGFAGILENQETLKLGTKMSLVVNLAGSRLTCTGAEGRSLLPQTVLRGASGTRSSIAAAPCGSFSRCGSEGAFQSRWGGDGLKTHPPGPIRKTSHSSHIVPVRQGPRAGRV